MTDDTLQLRGRVRRLSALIMDTAARMAREGRREEADRLVAAMDHILATEVDPRDFVQAHTNGAPEVIPPEDLPRRIRACPDCNADVTEASDHDVWCDVCWRKRCDTLQREDERARVIAEFDAWLSEYVDARWAEYEVRSDPDSYGPYREGIGTGCDVLYGAFCKRFMEGT